MQQIIITSPEELKAIISEAVSNVVMPTSSPQDLPDNITLETAVQILRTSGFRPPKPKSTN